MIYNFETMFPYIVAFIGLSWAAIIVTLLVMDVFIKLYER